MISNFFVQHGSATAQEHVRARAVVLFFHTKLLDLLLEDFF